MATPLAGVWYSRNHQSPLSWKALGRPELSAFSRDLIVPGSLLPSPTWVGIYDEGPRTVVTARRNYGTESNGLVVRNHTFQNIVSLGAPYITFINCLFEGPATPYERDPLVIATSAALQRVQFIDCTFKPRAPGSDTNAVNGHHFSWIRCDVSNVVDGTRIIPKEGGRADVEVISTWIHDLAFFSPDPYQSSNATHNDAIQWVGGKGLSVVGSRIEAFYNPNIGQPNDPPVISGGKHQSGNPYYPYQHATSCILANNHVAGTPPGEALIDQNWMDGGGAALVFSSATQMTDVGAVTNNRFGRTYDESLPQYRRGFRHGADFAILANTGATQPAQTFTLTGNTRWDNGAAFNIRKKGD